MNQGDTITAEKRTKILFVITKSNLGGAQKYVFDIATHLPRSKFDVAVVLGGDGTTGKPGALSEKLQEAQIRIIFLESLARDVHVYDLHAYRDLTEIFKKEQPDIVHLNSSKAGGLGALAAKMAGVPRIIFTAHGWAFYEPRNPLSRALIWFASVATIMLCHRVICVSEYDRRALAWLFGKKLVTIHNAVTTDVSILSRDEARHTLLPRGGHSSDIWIGSIAELNKNKNITRALTAIREARVKTAPLFYIIIGDGEEREALKTHTHSLGIESYVHFAGHVDNAASFVRAFDALLIPSLKEGLPYVILEAQRAGIP